MSDQTSSDLLRTAMQNHGVSSDDLTDRVLRDEAVGLSTARTLVNRFVDGGPCALGVAAALITIISQRKSVA